MKIHREGRNTILLFISLLLTSIVLVYLVEIYLVLEVLIVLTFLVLFLLILWFFRLPVRIPTRGDNLVIAPADGKIVVIENTLEEEYFKDERLQISIFMSPLNVHQNIYPISGEVKYTKYHKGKYLVAWHPKSSTLNERSTVVIRHKNGTEVLVRQIAGAVARRICTYSKPGDLAEQCGELGFIKFGSRVDIFLPVGTQVKCELNATSFSKQTIIAEL